MKPLKITVVGDGKSVHVRIRAEALRRLGHEVVLVSEYASEQTIPGEISPVLSGYWPGPFRRLQTFRHVFALARLLRSQRQDIIHIHFAKGFHAWVAFLVASEPVIVSTMGGDVLYEERSDNDTSWFTRRLIRMTLLGASLVTAKTKAMAHSLEGIGVPAERILPLVWGVDSSLYSIPRDEKLSRRLGVPVGAKVVFSPRSAKPFYNIALVIEAFAGLPSDDAGPILLIAEGAGDREYIDHLHELARTLGVAERVRFVGTLDPGEMPSYYSLADVTISLAPVDGMPQSLLESLASGTPVVITNLKHYRELVCEEHGVVFTELSQKDVEAGLDVALTDAGIGERAERGRVLVASDADIVQQARLWQEHAEKVLREVKSGPGLFDRVVGCGLLFGCMVLDPLWRRISGRR